MWFGKWSLFRLNLRWLAAQTRPRCESWVKTSVWIPTSAALTLQRRAYSKSNVKLWNSLYFSAVFLRRTWRQANTATLPFLVTCWQTAATAAPLMIDIHLEFCYIFHNCRDFFLVFFFSFPRGPLIDGFLLHSRFFFGEFSSVIWKLNYSRPVVHSYRNRQKRTQHFHTVTSLLFQ